MKVQDYYRLNDDRTGLYPRNLIMGYLVVFVLDNLDLCQDILDAWEVAGVKGFTIFESMGIGRIRQAGIRDDLPLLPILSELSKALKGITAH
jgi:hypothetical protein